MSQVLTPTVLLDHRVAGGSAPAFVTVQEMAFAVPGAVTARALAARERYGPENRIFTFVRQHRAFDANSR